MESLISLFNVNWPPYTTVQPSGWEMPLPSRRSLHPSRPWLELCGPLKARTATNSIVLSTFTGSAGYPKPTLTTVWIIGSRMTSGWCLQVLHPAALCSLAADTGSSGAGLQRHCPAVRAEAGYRKCMHFTIAQASCKRFENVEPLADRNPAIQQNRESVNEYLLPGPPLGPSLLGVPLSFHQHSFTMSGCTYDGGHPSATCTCDIWAYGCCMYTSVLYISNSSNYKFTISVTCNAEAS